MRRSHAVAKKQKHGANKKKLANRSQKVAILTKIGLVPNYWLTTFFLASSRRGKFSRCRMTMI